MTDDCKRHARLEIGKLLTRMCRKYSAETLTKLTPGDDVGKIQIYLRTYCF